MNPKVTIVVPVYNVEPYLRECLDSVLAQTFANWECICVDDGSTDESPSILDEFSRKDTRFRVIHQRNGGLSAARNAGLDWFFANSDSMYLTFLDSDDRISNEYIEQLLVATRTGGCCAIATIVSVDEKTGKADERRPPVAEMSTGEYWAQERLLPMIACGKLIPRCDFESIRFPVGLIHEDEFTTPKFLFKHECVAFADQAKYFYLRRENSITGNMWDETRLVAIDALKWQISFFTDRGDSRSADISRKRLALIYLKAVTLLNRREYLVPLRTILKTLSLSLVGNKDLYMCAYPAATSLKWPFVHFLDVIRRRGVFGTFQRCLFRLKRSTQKQS